MTVRQAFNKKETVKEYFKEKKVLLVEDDFIMQELITLLFEDLGINIMLADNGQAGYEKAIELKPDLILMDLKMPIMGGLEAIEKIRQHSDGKNLPVVILSAEDLEMNPIENVGLNIESVISKPVNLDELLPILNKFLG